MTLNVKGCWLKSQLNSVNPVNTTPIKDYEMYSDDPGANRTTGSCLCGAVTYRVRGRLRDVIACHCSKCRRVHGHFSAYASARRENLDISGKEHLKWYRSVTDETPNVHRGFCSRCGSSLFWDPRDNDYVYISAGTLDAPTGLKTVGNIWTSQAGDYYEISDSLPAYEGSSHGELVGSK